MKILVLQLARLGDIYMTWPVLRALKRTYPKAEIHLLTRPRFEGAIEGLNAVDVHHSLKVRTILSPLVQDTPDIETSVERLNETIDNLKGLNFDWVINLTFSPASSYLTKAISGPQTKISGYSRHTDGTLCLNDDMSAYFYAQVGHQKANRVHLADYFAALLNIEYAESDWGRPKIEKNLDLILPKKYVVVHIGASESHKSLSAQQWVEALTVCARSFPHLPLVLIGSLEERPVAEKIQQGLKDHKIFNMAGLTRIKDLFQILTPAEILVGCDSAPIHVASLTDTPTFNVSMGQVNFWETGPKATLGFIYHVQNAENLDPQNLGEFIAQTLQGELNSNLWIRSAGLVSYFKAESADKAFAWKLVQAIYLGGDYPLAERLEVLQGASQISQMNELALKQINLIPSRGVESIGPVLDRIEEVIESIGNLVPELAPVVRWYQAEKVRIGPADLISLCNQAEQVHKKLDKILAPYVPTDESIGEDHGAI